MNAIVMRHTVGSVSRSDRLSKERLARLFDDHHQRLYRLARRLGFDPDEARDVVQEAYLRAARRIGTVPQGGGREEGWLVRVVVNLARDRRRRLRVRTRAAALQARTEGFSPSPEGAAVARDAVQRALALLSPRRRAVVVLHLIEELPVVRIADLLGISAITVRWHLSMGRRQIAALLSGTRQ